MSSAVSAAAVPEDQHERIIKYIRMAIDQAWKSQEVDEVPVGCVVVHRHPEQGDVILAKAFNQTSALMNSSRHCEMVCIEHILVHMQLPMEVFRSCDLFVTCEPCLMCAYALRQVGFGRVFYGCDNKRFGGCGSMYSLHNRPDVPFPPYFCQGGFLDQECIELFRLFYESGNPNAPDHKRARVLMENPAVAAAAAAAAALAAAAPSSSSSSSHSPSEPMPPPPAAAEERPAESTADP